MLQKVGQKYSVLMAAIFTMGLLVAESASAQIVLPDTGVAVEDYVPLMVTALGVVVAAVIGGYVAFKVVKMGVRWLGKAGG